MDLSFSREDEQFRDEVRTWLRENVPRVSRPPYGPESRAFDVAWQRRQHDAGWAGISWPKEYGGRGLSLVQQLIWYEEYARAGGPHAGSMFVALNHGGPTLIVNGSDEQKRFHLPLILKGEAVWCQGFSEPGAGSDLASLRTRAVIDGDRLVVTGQKIWTSYGHLADYQELLVRTDPDAPKHKGISWVICDMRSPGITVRPIRVMTGGPHFCEVFYDEVRIPLSNVVGGLNQGWRVAVSTLSFERGTALTGYQVELEQTVERLLETARSPSRYGGPAPIRDGAIAARLANARAEVAALKAMTYAVFSRSMRNEVPGPESSIIALYFAELLKRVQALALDVLGPESLEASDGHYGWAMGYLDAFKHTIASGTAEIRRNIIGERVLGLPKG